MKSTVVTGSQSCRKALIAIVAINAVVFVALRLTMILDADAAASLTSALELHRSEGGAWWFAQLLTYQFVHLHFFHLLGNMVVLWCYGSLPRAFRGSWWPVAVYIAGGICGGAVYLILPATTTVGHYGSLIGASASVMAVAAAVTLGDLRRKVSLFGLRECPLWWITASLLAIDILSVRSGSTVSHEAHIAGVAAGIASGAIAAGLRRLKLRRSDSLSRSNNIPDRGVILDKIRKSGHNSLSAEERRALFNFSHRRGGLRSSK